MAGKKILVVDDEEQVLHLLKRKLTSAGFEVSTAKNGKEAITKAKSLVPDLILMDIMMPELDGPSAVKIIQEDPDISEPPIIFLSGILTREKNDGEEGEEDQDPHIIINNRRYTSIPKPFNSEELLNRIRRILKDPKVRT